MDSLENVDTKIEDMDNLETKLKVWNPYYGQFAQFGECGHKDGHKSEFLDILDYLDIKIKYGHWVIWT